MNLSWNNITDEKLKHLYYDKELTDREIADMFGVTIGKVTYKRRKFGITIRNMIYQESMYQKQLHILFLEMDLWKICTPTISSRKKI